MSLRVMILRVEPVYYRVIMKCGDFKSGGPKICLCTDALLFRYGKYLIYDLFDCMCSKRILSISTFIFSKWQPPIWYQNNLPTEARTWENRQKIFKNLQTSKKKRKFGLFASQNNLIITWNEAVYCEGFISVEKKENYT